MVLDLNLSLFGQNGVVLKHVDHNRKLKYTQSFRDNLNEIEDPVIVKGTGKPYTKVIFKPDYKRFGIPKGLSQDMLNIE